MFIGNAFYNTNENGSAYISISLDETVTELYPELSKVRFSLLEIPQEERKENSPHYRLSMYKPKEKKA